MTNSRIRIKDIANMIGVSPSTVSQYLNKRYNHMSQETREKIESVIKELGYQPNGIARSLKIKKTNTIGVIVANILHTFSTFVSRGIEDYCHNNGYNVILCNADNDPQKEKNYIQMLRMKQVDGIIIAATGENNEFIKENIQKNLPVVQIDRYFDNLTSDIVLADNYKYAYKAVEYLINLNHRRIALIVPNGKLLSVRKERIEGYYEALKAHNIPVDLNLIKFISKNNVKVEMDNLFNLYYPPSAFFVTNDLTTIEVLTYLKENKINIPDEVSIISFDDLPVVHLLNPPLTVVAQPAYDIGKVAAEILIKRIEKEEDSEYKKIVLPCNLILRNSCQELKNYLSKNKNKLEEIYNGKV